MKSINLFFVFAVALLLSSNTFAAEKIKIGFALPTQADERWVMDLKAMDADAAEAGVELRTEISHNNQMQQNEQVSNLLNQGINVLILAAHDCAGAASAVKKAHEAGVKVISYDRLILNADVDVYVSFDNERVGEIQGEFITKLVPQGGYIIMSGAPSDNNAKQFKAGAMKRLQPLIDSGQIKVVADQAVIDWYPENARKIVEKALAKNGGQVDAILAPNDGTAGGAIEALAAHGLAGQVPVTGQDSEVAAAKRIVAGLQSMTVFKDTRQEARSALALAVKLAKGESIASETTHEVNNGKLNVPSVLLTPILVDKNNLDNVLISSGYLTREEIYGN